MVSSKNIIPNPLFTFLSSSSPFSPLTHLQGERIEELEEALRESVAITAEREMAMAEQQDQIKEAERQVGSLHAESDALRRSCAEYRERMDALTKRLEDRDARLAALTKERNKQLEEVFEMKQEAILAAISEKDANIALLEMSTTKKQSYQVGFGWCC